MKRIMNQALTNSVIFPDYDQVIEPMLAKLCTDLNIPEIVEFEVYDCTKSLPLSDPGNEKAFIIKLDCEDAMPLYDHLTDRFQQHLLIEKINAQLDSSGDYAANLDAIIQTNSDILLLFTYLK